MSDTRNLQPPSGPDKDHCELVRAWRQRRIEEALIRDWTHGNPPLSPEMDAAILEAYFRRWSIRRLPLFAGRAA
jgi:hypothetical protein